MSFWNAVVIIVAIAAYTNLRMAKLHGQGFIDRHGFHGRRSRGSYDPKTDPQPSPRELELEREVIALRKRLEVLERIATDANSQDRLNSQSIAAEIESLRDR